MKRSTKRLLGLLLLTLAGGTAVAALSPTSIGLSPEFPARAGHVARVIKERVVAEIDKRMAPPPPRSAAVIIRPVMTAEVRFAPAEAPRTLVGSLRPRIESDLGFRVAGKVEARLVSVGDRIRKGQPIARLDATDLRLQLDQAVAELAAAKSSFSTADAELSRARTLKAKGWATNANLDRAAAAADEAEARVERADKTHQIAANAMSYATLAADADGVVTAAMIEPGQVVAAGQPALRLARTDEIEAVVAIPEAMIEAARSARAEVSLWSDSGQKFAAKLRELSPSADPVSRTYLARFTLPELPASAAFGMTASVTLSASKGKEVARLPLSALIDQGKGSALWVVDPGSQTLRLVPVEVAGLGGSDVLIASGVKDGDAVVTLGVQKLEAGQRVRPIADSPES
jgi:RND family efflux transporter MFP subunit